VSICAKGVSTGVHNIAFSLSPDRFRAFDLFFFFGAMTVHIKGFDQKVAEQDGDRGGIMATVKGTHVKQDAVAEAFAFYHGP
jgi:hypothetical protein